MAPPNTFGDTPVPDPVTTNQLLIGLHARLDAQDEVLDEIKRFFKGDEASGKDGAVSRLNSHSKDIGDMRDKVGEIKEEMTWVRRGVIAALCGIVIGVAGWGLSKVADGAAQAQPPHK